MDVYCIILLTFSIVQNFILRSVKIFNNLRHRTKEVDQIIIYQVIIVTLGLA